MRSRASFARSTALLLVLGTVGPAICFRTPSALSSFGPVHHGRSLLQQQLSCCSAVNATATGGTVECGAAGLVLTVTPTQFAPIAASVTVTSKSGGTTVAMNPAALLDQTCSSLYGAATWGSAGGATTLAVTATAPTCATLTSSSCQGLATRLTPRGKLALATMHTCTLRAADGAVLCSGQNDVGQLGVGTQLQSSSLVAALAPGSGPGILTNATWVAASTSVSRTCACLSTGEAVCWGGNSGGQLGAASTAPTFTRPVYVVTDSLATARLASCRAVATGPQQTLFLTSAGDIFAAGGSPNGQLGLGSTTASRYAAQVTRDRVGGKAATSVCAADYHSCAVFEDGTVACVGGNEDGQLGRGSVSFSAQLDWAFVVNISDAVHVQCGQRFTCVLRGGGKVSCFGAGSGTGNNGVANPQLAPFDTIPSGAVDLATGSSHGCATMDDATVKCWGINGYGQLGDGTTTSTSTPRTSRFVGAMTIGAGTLATCIINGIGQRLCAGYNTYNQLALSSAVNSNSNPTATVIPAALVPTSFAAPPPFVTISDASNPICSLLLSVKVVATCDPTPPVFNPPLANIAAAATSTAGAVVAFNPIAIRAGVPVTATCTPTSGFLFAMGNTTVTCTAGVTTGTFVVSVAVSAPLFAANAPAEFYEASTATPYLGTTLGGKYAPNATDAIDGDLSGTVKTYLAATNAPIALATYVFPLGTTAITHTVNNSYGLVAKQTVTIAVRDSTPPAVAVAGAAEVVVTGPGIPINYDSKCTATDLANFTLTYAPPTGGTAGTAPFNYGSRTTVTCTATDSSGNIATGTFTVVVSQPPPPPSFGPTPDGTFEATTATPYLGTTLNGKYAPTATDPVQGDVSASIKTYLTATNEQIYLSGLSSYLFPLGATAVRNVLRDDYGRVFEQAATIAVADRTPPALSVAGPAEVLLAGPGAVDYAGKCTATDLAPVTVTYSPPSGGTLGTAPFLAPSTTKVTCTATDSSGNFATGTFTVTVRAPPTLGPGPAGPFEATTATPDLGTTLGGKYAPTASDPQDGDLSGSVKTYLTATNELITLATYVFPRGQTNITHVVTNTFGLTAQQTVTIKVRDTTPPAVTVAAPAEVVVTGPGTVDHTGKCTATDLAPVTVTYSPPSGTAIGTAPFLAGSTTTVTCTATDPSGNKASGTFTVTVTAPPTAPTFGPGPAGPFEATTATPYLGTSVAGKYAPTATDAVQGDISDAIVTYLAATNAPIALATYVFPLGTTAITHAVTNSRGITAQQAVTIKVVDTTKPALTVDNNVLVTQPQSAPLKTVHYPNRCNATDLAPVTVTYSPPSGGTVGSGPFTVPSVTTVTCTATDSSGNKAKGTFTVTVRRPSDKP